ncbi:MAG: beta-ketoacyl-[acyl-carrier-protein] synthase family protein [Ktedonobacteraceae bacterium]|nr:beta-ketoacyl-[acyl-carrier-protein] synthase family protein [Ktedonobacteraceae bacterium]MBV9617125.1 beta-ketoacyl-[acyl-carrier-protein] synthase family protein [Ktedonobacteraceae bacterium]
MSKRVVAITGIGTLTPAGRGTEALWTCISSGRTCISPIDPQRYFEPFGPCKVAGQVPSFSEPRVLTESMIAQTDRCSQLALVAVLDALDMAKLPIDFRSEDSPVASECVSLTVATVGAGWNYVEREMRNLWTKGVGAMDRYGLTAGFPAGPQGHISIFFGVEGRTRTFISERASGAQALIEGAKAIQRGDADVVIAGGTEAPITPIAWAAYHASNMLQPTSGDPVHEHTGMLLGEGSTFLILEELEHARRREVPILAEVSGWSRGTDPCPLEGARKQPGRCLSQSIHTSLAQADIQPTAINAIFPAGPALPEEDTAEEVAIRSTFEQPLPLVTPKAILGHLQGAATATDVAIAALALERQEIPPTPDVLWDPDFIKSTSEGADLPLRHILILSGGLGGIHASLIVSKSE